MKILLSLVDVLDLVLEALKLKFLFSNVNIPESLAPTTHEEVVTNVKKAEPNLIRLIEGFLDRLEY